MSENKYQELKALLKGEPLETFDVREHVFTQIGHNSNVPNNGNKMKKQKREEFEHDKNIFDKYDGRNRILIKTAIGKKWAGFFNYDYDASRFANLIYKAAWFPSGDIEPIGCVEKYEYVTVYDGRYFRGDTMNSWSTTLNEFVRTLGERYVHGWKGRYIPVGYNSWEAFLSDPKSYKKAFPDYITDFMKVVYTVGNFIPVPLAPSFNTCRSRLCHDYWDLTLLAIYRHYEKNDAGNSNGWSGLLSREGVKCWLDGYGSWDAFVEGNFLQDFVDEKTKNGYGMPKPLWAGHVDKPGLPKEGKFEEFFTNAAAWITARGKKIAIALADALGPAAEQESDAGEGAI